MRLDAPSYLTTIRLFYPIDAICTNQSFSLAY